MAVAQTLKMRLQNARKPGNPINDVMVATPIHLLYTVFDKYILLLLTNLCELSVN